MRKLLAPYFSFQGRSTRREWWIIEICVIFGFKLNGVIYESMALEPDGFASRFDLGQEASQTYLLFGFTLLLLNIASNVRRLHDRGKSGWWSLPYIIPGFGQMWCFIECGFLKGQPHANRYGPVPGGQAGEAFAMPALRPASAPMTFADIRAQIAAIIKASPEQRAATKAPAPRRPSSLPNSNAATARASRPEPRRRSVLAAQSASAVTRVEHGRRNLTAAFVIGIAILLGAGAVFLSSHDFAVTPAAINPKAGTFENIDSQLVPLNNADD